MEGRKDEGMNQILLNNFSQNNIKNGSYSVEHLFLKGKNHHNSLLNSKTSIQSNLSQNQIQNIFVDQFGMNNSYINVILHLCYRIKSIYNFYMKKITKESDKFSIHLHNIFVSCNNNYDCKIIDISKLKSSLFKLNSNFQINEINNPINFLNLIIENTNLKNDFSFKNIKIKDICDCGYSISFNIDKFQNIFDIPLLDIIKISENHSTLIYNNQGKLIHYYKKLIEHNFTKKINCPLNSVDCNYNRVSRNFLLNPNENNNSNMKFLLFDFIINNRSNFSMLNLLESLMLIPMSFDLEDLFNFEEKNHFEEIDNNFDKYIFSGCIFKTNSKSYTCVFKSKSNWVYYDDNENIINFQNWFQVIQYILKNNLLPYLLYYSFNNEMPSENLSIEEYNLLENFAIKYDEYKEISSLRIKLYDYVNIIMREDSDNIKLEDFKDFNDFTISRNSIPKNPYKRVKKNNSYNTRELNNNSLKNQPNNIFNINANQITDELLNFFNENNQTLKKCKSSNLHHKKENDNNFPLKENITVDNAIKLYNKEENEYKNNIENKDFDINNNNNFEIQCYKTHQKFNPINPTKRNNINNNNYKKQKTEEKKGNDLEKKQFIKTYEETLFKKKKIISKADNSNMRTVFKRADIDSKENINNNMSYYFENGKNKTKKYINISSYKNNNNLTEPGMKSEIINQNKSINDGNPESFRNYIPKNYSKNSFRSREASFRKKNDDGNNYTLLPKRKQNTKINYEKSFERKKQNNNNTLKLSQKKKIN